MVHTCLKCTCNEKLAFPLFVSSNVIMLRLHMFLELNAHKLNSACECTNSYKMEIFCGKPQHSQAVGFWGS